MQCCGNGKVVIISSRGVGLSLANDSIHQEDNFDDRFVSGTGVGTLHMVLEYTEEGISRGNRKVSVLLLKSLLRPYYLSYTASKRISTSMDPERSWADRQNRNKGGC